MKQKIYISIPMDGRNPSIQKARAKDAKLFFKERNWDVVNPFTLGSLLEQEHFINGLNAPTYTNFLADDIEHLKECDAIYMCKEWHESKGCLAEFYFAKAIGLQIIFER